MTQGADFAAGTGNHGAPVHSEDEKGRLVDGDFGKRLEAAVQALRG
ncbi:MULTISPECIES: hypothetical protein [unclassified Streptomyces]